MEERPGMPREGLRRRRRSAERATPLRTLTARRPKGKRRDSGETVVRAKKNPKPIPEAPTRGPDDGWRVR